MLYLLDFYPQVYQELFHSEALLNYNGFIHTAHVDIKR